MAKTMWNRGIAKGLPIDGANYDKRCREVAKEIIAVLKKNSTTYGEVNAVLEMTRRVLAEQEI